MSILNYNGGTVVGMTGKDCVAIACDKRFGVRNCTIDANFNKIYEIAPTIFIGMAGLTTDAITVSKRLKFRKNMFELRENRKITPHIFASMVSNMLYEKRFGPYYVEPIIAGLDDKGEPHLYCYDLIGCLAKDDQFACSGSGADQCFGACETLWEPNLEPDALFETISQSLANGLERDAASGWGGFVYVIEKDKVTVSELKGRVD